MLDLFKLHSKDDHPKGWIWVNFNPLLLKREYLKLLKPKSQNEITYIINKNLNAGYSTIQKHLIKLKYSNKNLWLPLPLIVELANLIKRPNLKPKIISSFKYFICKTSPTKQKAKAVKETSETLANFVGAFIADGHSKQEVQSNKLRITDGRQDLILAMSKKIKNIFGINPIIRFNKSDNTYICWFNNKVIARYLKNIFEIPSGKKAYIVKEPHLIKNSSFKIRKAFASGVISFDGGVKATGNIAISSMSKHLIHDLYNIFRLDNMKVNLFYNKKKCSWLLESSSGRDKVQQKKWLSYFEYNTWKYNRLKFFIANKKYSINELNYLFPKHYHSKISLNKVYNSAKSLKFFNINDISKGFHTANTALYKYLYILEKANLINKNKNTNVNWSLKCQQ